MGKKTARRLSRLSSSRINKTLANKTRSPFDSTLGFKPGCLRSGFNRVAKSVTAGSHDVKPTGPDR